MLNQLSHPSAPVGSILYKVVKKDLTEEVILEQSPERNGKLNSSNVWKKAFEGNSKCEYPESAWHHQRRSSRPVRLPQRDLGGWLLENEAKDVTNQIK